MFWVVFSRPSLGNPSLHRGGNKVLNLCNGIQLGCAPGSTLTSIIMVPAFTWHPDCDVCYDLRPIVWVSVCVQHIHGLTLKVGALSQFAIDCIARKPVVCTFFFFKIPFLKGLGLIHYQFLSSYQTALLIGPSF